MKSTSLHQLTGKPRKSLLAKCKSAVRVRLNTTVKNNPPVYINADRGEVVGRVR